MRDVLVFKRSKEALLNAFFDPECHEKRGYNLKKFEDGYRYYPLGCKKTYLIRNTQIFELGQHILTFYWSGQTNSGKRFNCLVIPFNKKVE